MAEDLTGFEEDMAGLIDSDPAIAVEDESAQGATDDESVLGESPTPDEDQTQEEPPDGPKGGGVQKRIDELTREKRELERDKDRLLDALAGLGKGADVVPKEMLPGSEDDLPPQPEQNTFESYEAYTEALVDWKAEKKVREAEKRIKSDLRREQGEAAKSAALEGKYEAARAKVKDFDAVVANTVVTESIATVIESSDYPAEIAYYLGKKTDVRDALNKLSPLDAARAIGKIEAEIHRRLNPATSRTLSSPPELQRPVSGVKPGAAKDPSKMSNEEYRRMRQGEKK